MDQQHHRFKDAEWFVKENILVGGAGGIGSWLVNLLARIGHNIYVYDMDTVETHNLGGQLYSVDDVRTSKVEATAQMVKRLSGEDLNIFHQEYTEDSPTSPIVFTGFDNIESRKVMFDKWKTQENREVFIDGRMLAESGQVYTVVKGNEAKYEATLFKKGEGAIQPCTMKATSHCAALIASLMVSSFNNYLGKREAKTVRTVPFRIEYMLPIMYFVTKDK